MNDISWETIFRDYKIYNHKFDDAPFHITADMIKQSTKRFDKTSEKRFEYCVNKILEIVDQKYL